MKKTHDSKVLKHLLSRVFWFFKMIRACNLSYRNMLELESKELSEEVSHTHGEKANDQVAKHGLFGWGFSQFRTGITSEDQG